jgi:hypothetical protein
MARHIERVFDPRQPLVTRRFFVAAGRHYNPGDPFEWRRLSVDQRRVKLLFDAGKIMHPVTEGSPIELEVQDEDIHHIAVTAASADEQPAAPEQVSSEPAETAETAASDELQDDLTDLTMKELRAIADAEGAPFRVSRDAQREAIREHRHARDAG